MAPRRSLRGSGEAGVNERPFASAPFEAQGKQGKRVVSEESTERAAKACVAPNGARDCFCLVTQRLPFDGAPFAKRSEQAGQARWAKVWHASGVKEKKTKKRAGLKPAATKLGESGVETPFGQAQGKPHSKGTR